MEGYISAVGKMEQTVMFPSILQGVPLEEGDEAVKTEAGEKDLHGYFALLKSIKTVVERALAPLEGQHPSVTVIPRDEEGQEKASVEGLFYYHVSGLYHVLAQLTKRANAVIAKYSEIVGQINQNRIVAYW